jgi:putative membrane protein
MKLASFLLLCAGTALFGYLIADQGIASVLNATAAAGWGVLIVAFFHFVPMVGDTLAWLTMMSPTNRLTYPAAFRIRWIGESVNNLLPAAPVSGELVRTRLAMFSGMSGPAAGASVTADLTFGALSQVVFSLLGVGALLYLGATFGNAIVAAISVGLVVVGALLGLFMVLQNFGLFRYLADKLVSIARGRAWLDLVGGAGRMDAELTALYRRRGGVAWSLFWRLAAWLAGTGEIWLGMYFLGHPIGLIEAIMVESVIQAIRAAAFAIPGGLGVQEAGFVLLGSFIGMGPDISLALALIRRARELLFGVPGLIVWQIQEGHRILKRDRG